MVCFSKYVSIFYAALTSDELVFLQPVEYNSYFAGACISWRRDANGGEWQPHYRITDHLGSTRLETSSNGTITAAYDYKLFGEQIPLMTTKTRKTYIGKERDEESYLGDFGVRKYDYAAGRFTSPDVLWEKYMGWSPYHYCGNNPMSYKDDNGMWVAELSSASHINNGGVSRNSNGYLAGLINYSYYNKWQETAPNVAKWISKNSFFAMQTSLEKAVLGNSYGKLINIDTKKTNKQNNTESTTIHEIVHQMGNGDLEAYGAEVANGTLSMRDLKALIRQDPFAILQSNNPELMYLQSLTSKIITNPQSSENEKIKATNDAAKIAVQTGKTVIGGK